jgi:hypothetical protein
MESPGAVLATLHAYPTAGMMVIFSCAKENKELEIVPNKISFFIMVLKFPAKLKFSPGETS